MVSSVNVVFTGIPFLRVHWSTLRGTGYQGRVLLYCSAEWSLVPAMKLHASFGLVLITSPCKPQEFECPQSGTPWKPICYHTWKVRGIW